MLTFFEYLRQRAYRSILAGAEDALEELEGNSPDDERKSADRLLEKFRDGAERNPPIFGAASEDSPEGEEKTTLPPPRKRGRPRKVRP